MRVCRYARRQPYGEWLARQVVTLKDVVTSVPEAKRQPKFLAPAHAADPSADAPGGNQEAGLLALLEPLKMFGWVGHCCEPLYVCACARGPPVDDRVGGALLQALLLPVRVLARARVLPDNTHTHVHSC